MPTPDDISRLIARVALADRPAFDSLYAHTSAKLFGVVLRLLNDRAEAEDALQEVFVKVWQRADRYTVSGASPMSWLIAIARNHAIDRLRARRGPAAPIDVAAEIADPAPSPEAATVAASERGRIENCLGRLDTYRAWAVRAAYLEGHSYRQIADRLDVPLNTVRTWLRRSLLKLRQCLEE
ncbi:sigma-70 family RNA polymerase sigma factor [Rhodobacteraceae bacterium 2CG4]|uniref:Sigma-70 family RNA polymerase sigma factor n=1 Tax=Halovulum marinum TaxID=2662447 RepID=A0A6L5YX20_9RHOB|nr:sigma-70 family RNA polymerase sigma factor [Halovulum marinum]MSU88903.1 sigma-70 family RNA polymerase sigma factor [Halovulum marinum]